MMKKLLIALVAVMTAGVTFAQIDVVEKPTTEPAWKANFYELTREERGALWTDPKVDQEELKAFLASLRKEPRSQNRSSGGGEFSCDAWYTHNQLNSETIMPEDWIQFDGGCGAGGAVDSYFGPIALPFDFCLFGQAATEMYINTKGTITFDEPMCDWTPETIPAAGYNQISAYWADSDFTASGYVEYEILADAAIITFWDVGYYNANSDLVNTFQIVVTNGGSTVLGAGFNVGFLFQDMQWAHGDVGGATGFGGPTPGTIGVDDDGTTNGFQLGRFNTDTDDYDGPFDGEDGINWLDYKSFIFSICEDPTDPSQGTPSNYPPVSSNQLGGLNGVLPDVASCDTLFICSNELQDFAVTFLAPEDDQILTITVDDPSGVMTDINTTGTDWVEMTGQIFGNPDAQGTHTVDITITDNGSPAQTLTQTFIISILEFEAPEMEILGDSVFCSIDGTTLTVVPDNLDYYDWSFDACDGSNTCDISFEGLISVEGSLGPCKNTESIYIDPSAYFIPCITPNPSFACTGDSVLICSCDEWAGYSFEIWDDPQNDVGGIIYSMPSDSCVYVGPGYYVFVADDEAGCQGQNIFEVQAGSGLPPEVEPLLFCETLEPLELFGMGPPSDGNLTVYLGTTGDEFGEAFLEVCVLDPLAPLEDPECSIIPVPAGEIFVNTTVDIQTFSQISVSYLCPALPDTSWMFNTVWLYNCDNDSLISFTGPYGDNLGGGEADFELSCGVIWEGLGGCEITPLEGTWEWDSCDPLSTGSFSVEDQFTSTFTPDGYGVYNLYFYDPFCEDPYEYEVEWSEPPLIEFDPDIYDLCFEASQQISPTFLQSVECAADYNWTATSLESSSSAPNYTESSDGSFITVTGTDEYENWQFIVDVANGCGSAQDTVWVEVHTSTELELEDATLCDGSTVVLDPTPGMPDLNYLWTCTGECDCYDGPYTDPNLEVECTGTWSVEVSNECWADDVSADVVVSPGWGGDWDGTLLECDEDFIIQCASSDIEPIPAGFGWEWFFNGVSFGNIDCMNMTGNGFLQIEVYDPICDQTYSDETDVFITDPPSFSPSPSVMDTTTLCPTEVQIFNIGEVFSGNLSWTLYNCDGSELDLGSESSVQLASDMFPNDCLGEYQQLVMDYSNSCGTQTETWNVQANACELLIPNIFTPGSDNLNDAFVILGIEAYDRASLQVFDRWGGLVFEDSAYDNKWAPTDLTSGTYYFVLQVFDSTDTMLDDWASYVLITAN